MSECAAASITKGSVSLSMSNNCGMALLAPMSPNAWAAAARTSSFSSLSAVSAASSAFAFPVSSPSTRTALTRFSQALFVSPPFNTDQAFSCGVCATENVVIMHTIRATLIARNAEFIPTPQVFSLILPRQASVRPQRKINHHKLWKLDRPLAPAFYNRETGKPESEDSGRHFERNNSSAATRHTRPGEDGQHPHAGVPQAECRACGRHLRYGATPGACRKPCGEIRNQGDDGQSRCRGRCGRRVALREAAGSR